MKKLTLIASLSFLLVNNLHAREHTFFSGFSPNVQVIGRNNQYLGPSGYHVQNNVKPFWAITQWGNSSDLQPNTYSSPRIWEIANSNTRVKFFPSLNGKSNVYELAAANIPCGQNSSTAANELDLFIEPKQMAAPSNLSLVDMGQLIFKLDMNVVYSHKYNKCNHNLQSDVASFVFNRNSYPYQTLFVQFQMNGLQGSSESLNWCPDYEKRIGNYNQFCLDTSINKVGGRYFQGLGESVTNVDILPGIIDIITSNHAKAEDSNQKINGNLKNWYLSGVYLGKVNYGGVNTTTRISNPYLRAEGGTFCAGNKRVQYICSPPIGDGWGAAGGGCYHRGTDIGC